MRLQKSLKKTLAAALSVLLLVMPLTGCSTNTGSDQKVPEKEAPMKEAENWAEQMNVITLKHDTEGLKSSSFDAELLQWLSEQTEGNYMASPLSFRYALGLLISGAEGETRAELLRALGVKDAQEWTDFCLRFNGFVQEFSENYQLELKQHRENVSRGWIPDDGSEPFWALRVANSVWRNESLPEKFTEKYAEYVSKNYAAEYRSFLPENVAEKVNEWASIKTEKMIEKLLPDGYNADGLAVILMNALYFKDNWLHEFHREGTEEGDFHKADGTVVTKEFMHQMNHFSYYKDDATELVVLPMKGGVNMVFVLGDTKDLAEKINKADYRRVDVTIPKMDLETSFSQGEFSDFLKAKGVSLAFDPEHADFSGMIGSRVWLSDIIQKTRIKLDEEGVEAAAVTALLMMGTGYDPNQPVEFRADRPFSFAIYTDLDGEMATMFAGRIVE